MLKPKMSVSVSMIIILSLQNEWCSGRMKHLLVNVLDSQDKFPPGRPELLSGETQFEKSRCFSQRGEGGNRHGGARGASGGGRQQRQGPYFF